MPDVDAIVAPLAAELREGDRMVILSNGGFGGIHEKLLRALWPRRQRRAAALEATYAM